MYQESIINNIIYSMSISMRQVVSYLVTVLIISSVFTIQVFALDYTISTLSISLDTDGFANVEYQISTIPTVANISLPLLGDKYVNFLVTDQNQDPLNYTISGVVVTVLSFGASVDISYSTQSLTSKIGDLWSMNFTSPVSIDILLPQGDTLVSLSQIPLEISTINQRQSILLPDGPNEITYQLGIVGTKEHSLLVITDAENAVNQAKSSGIIVTSAEAILSKAKKFYSTGNYISAEDYAGQARNAVTTITAIASDADSAIKTASTSIDKAKTEGRTNGLDAASSLLSQAQTAYSAGNYTKASSTASQATSKADLATNPQSNLDLILGAGTVFAIILLAVVIRRRPPSKKEQDSEKKPEGVFDPEAIIKKFPDLRDEDKQVVRFLAKSGGEAYADEIRDKVGMPKTSTWRLIRRLEGLGIVSERKIAGKSLVYLEDRYRIS